jgi:peroxiredoxin
MSATVNLKVGDKAPDFILTGVVTKPEAQRVTIKLSDYLGKQNVVLAFHPLAWTPI